MNIDINVKDRQISTQASCLIPAGSRNDAFMKFIFDPGYGWEGLEITAVFTRTDRVAYRTHIQPDVYVPIPTNILGNPGVFFVSLIGCKDADTVATTQTLAFTVENNAMNILRPTPYPVKDDNAYDSDAYAQYVSLVNDAANRAEAAAKYLEENAAGSYTKAESDERYMKRFTLSTTVEKCMDMSNVITGDAPEIVFSAYEVNMNSGTLYDPAIFDPVEAIRINIKDCKGAVTNIGYTGFKLYRLGNLCDQIIVNRHGATLKKCIHSVKVGDLDGYWADDITYVASMVTVPPIDLTKRDYIKTNVGTVISSALNDRLTFTFPEHIDATILANIEVAYPLAEEYTKIVSTVPGPVVAENSYLRVFYTKNQTEYMANLFNVSAEFDLQKYLNKLSDGHIELAVADMQEQVNSLTENVARIPVMQMYSGPRYNSNKDFWKVDSAQDNLLGMQVNAVIMPVNILYVANTNVYKPLTMEHMDQTDTSCVLWFDADTIKAGGNVLVLAVKLN